MERNGLEEQYYRISEQESSVGTVLGFNVSVKRMAQRLHNVGVLRIQFSIGVVHVEG